MAATGSEPRARRRISLRLRLTALYGACFLAGSGAVLALTDVVVAHETSSASHKLHLSGTKLSVPSSGLSFTGATAGTGPVLAQVYISPNGQEVISYRRAGVHAQTQAGHALSGGRAPQHLNPTTLPIYATAQLTRIRTAAHADSACVRAHGFPWYPNLGIVRDASGHGIDITTPRSEDRRILAAGGDPAFAQAARACAPLLNSQLSTTGVVQRIAPSTQKQIDVVVRQANSALAAQRRHSLHVLLTWSAVALGVAAAISVLLGWLLAGRALSPLRRMSRSARRITEANLHERLGSDTNVGELGELADTFDGVLARLEQAFASQRRFVANASHELRTPVTLERTLLEVALASGDDDPAALRRTCERVLESAKRQQTTIEALLVLASSQDAGDEAHVAVDLADLAQDVIALSEQQLATLTLTTDLSPAPASGDPALLERLLSNLVENAVVHNLQDDGWISLETGQDDTGSWLRVANSGAEVPEAMATEIFEPFRRVSGERTARVPGLGLGLSIVQAIADAHRAEVAARPLSGGGLLVELRF